MSETGNPARYMSTKDNRDGAWLTLEGEVMPMDQLPRDDTPIVAYVLAKGETEHYPQSDRPIEQVGLTIYGRCIAEEMGGYGVDQVGPNEGDKWVDSPCELPVVTIINGWSAGPCPFCQDHLNRLVEEMGEEGLQWKPVRTTGPEFRSWMVMPGCGPLFMWYPEYEGKPVESLPF